MMELNSKLIVNSAWIIDGEIYVGKRHSDCRDEYLRMNQNAKPPIEWIQWFITDEWVFLDRKIAAKIAKETWQCSEKVWDILYSEDLW